MSEKLDRAFEGLVKPKPGSGVTCRRCGQELKDPESIANGIGPICATKEADDEYNEANPETPDANS
jgi:hypothetical protein